MTKRSGGREGLRRGFRKRGEVKISERSSFWRVYHSPFTSPSETRNISGLIFEHFCDSKWMNLDKINFTFIFYKIKIKPVISSIDRLVILMFISFTFSSCPPSVVLYIHDWVGVNILHLLKPFTSVIQSVERERDSSASVHNLFPHQTILYRSWCFKLSKPLIL